MKKTVQVKNTQLSKLQGEYGIPVNVCSCSSTLPLVLQDQLQTVNKVLEAKDTELQAMQKLTKDGEGEAFCEGPLHAYTCTSVCFSACTLFQLIS